MPEHTTVDTSGREPVARRRVEAVLCGLSGAVATALVLLALVVIGASIVGIQRGYPGPRALEIGGHGAAAVLAVVLQRQADGRRGPLGWLAAFGVLAVAGATLWLWWWR